MDVSEAILKGVQTLQANDTGAGGLNETAGDALLNTAAAIVPEGDANYDRGEGQTDPVPYVRLGVVEQDDSAFDFSTSDRVNCIVEFHVITDRDGVLVAGDGGRGRQNAICSAIRRVYNGATLASQTGWTIRSPMVWLRAFQAASTGNRLHRVVQFSLRLVE